MIFTGSQLTLKRSVYTQTEFYGFTMEATVDNTSGIYHFGLSGSANTIDFKLESGYIYWSDKRLQSYRSYEPFIIEGQFTSGAANVIKDGAALVFGAPKPTGYYDTFYFSRADANMGATFDVNVSGNNAPVYSIAQQGYLVSSGQNAVTGWFSNQGGFPVRVFDSSMQASANYSFGKLVADISAQESGAFAFTGDYSSIDFSQPILTTFATSFGNIDALFSITDVRTLDRFVQLTAPTDFTFNSTGVLNRDVTWLNYSGGVVTSNFDTSLVFRLAYLTGHETFTGAWNIFTGGSPTSLLPLSSSTGLFSGSGNFSPNSYINFQVSYSGVSGNQAALLISGNEILNPISTTLTFNA